VEKGAKVRYLHATR